MRSSSIGVASPAVRSSARKMVMRSCTKPGLAQNDASLLHWRALLPVSSFNSRLAACKGFSPASRRPAGSSQRYLSAGRRYWRTSRSGDFGGSGASLDTKPGALRTPQPSTGQVRSGAATTVRSGSAAHALAGDTRSAISLAAGTLTARRHAIGGPADVLVARAQDGTAILRHRHGGATIATLAKTGAGKWVATVNGTDLAPRDHQRTALMEAVGTWNKAVTGALQRTEAPLQPPPQQTELMAEYGIPAIRALATPTAGAGDGPRMTTAGGDGT